MEILCLHVSEIVLPRVKCKPLAGRYRRVFQNSLAYSPYNCSTDFPPSRMMLTHDILQPFKLFLKVTLSSCLSRNV